MAHVPHAHHQPRFACGSFFRPIFLAAAVVLLAATTILAAESLRRLPTAGSKVRNNGTVYVSTTGSDVNGDGTQGNPYLTIQFAYERAADGDTIRVMPGTYNECLFLSGLMDPPFTQRDIHLLADAFDPGDPATRLLTVIDGSGQCAVPFSTVNIGGFDSSVEGFAITGGPTSGVFTIGGVTITNNVIQGNTSSSGGGIYAYPKACYYGSTTTTITNNLIQGNEVVIFGGYDLSGRGGGIFLFGRPEPFRPGDPVFGSGCTAGSPEFVVEGNEIRDNSTEQDGGGVFVITNTIRPLSAVVTITRNLITDNTAGVAAGAFPTTGYGGGIYVTTFGYGTEQIFITENQVLRNVASGFGGGIWGALYSGVYSDHTLEIDDNLVSENRAGLGGGMEVLLRAFDLEQDQRAELSVTNNTIRENVATTNDLLGGGGGLSAGIFSQRTTVPGVGFLIQKNSILDNLADVDGGGAELRVISDSENVFDPSDSAIHPSNAVIDFANNLVARNESSNSFDDGVGGGVFVFLQAFGESESLANVNLNSIAANTSQAGAGGVELESYTGFDSQFLAEGLAVLEINSSIVADNSGFGLGGPFPGDAGLLTPGMSGGDTANQSISVAYSDFFSNSEGNYENWIVDRTGQSGNISEDPRFHTPGSDFHLLASSPAVDAGDPLSPAGAPVTDIDGDPRILDGDGDGTPRLEMGADEVYFLDLAVQPPPPLTAECSSSGGVPDSDPAIQDWLGSATATPLCGQVTLDHDAPGFFPLGTTTVTFSATDECGNTGSAESTVTVVDTTPPGLVVPEDLIVECASPEGTLVDIGIAEAWDVCCGEEAPVSSDAPAVFPLGETIVIWRAIDCEGNEVAATQRVTVVDTRPPQLSLVLDPTVLWPPNHGLVEVTAVVEAMDTCGPATVVLASVASNEPDDAPGGGDGHTTGDIQGAEPGTADFQFQLRAERAGSGAGRAYRVTYTAADSAGNEASAAAEVLVPHDRKGVQGYRYKTWETSVTEGEERPRSRRQVTRK